jgi:hypothetical protein
LRELIDTPLQQLLIGAKIAEFIGSRARQRGNQCDRGGQPAQCRYGADIPLFGHWSPKNKSYPRKGRTFLSTYDIARVAAIQARVVRLVVFSSQRG